MRNSSLVKKFCAENVTGLKHATEAAGLERLRAFQAVGERSQGGEGRAKARLERWEVSMPELVTIKRMKNPFAACLRFPGLW